MKVSEGGFKRFKLIISEGSLPQCEEKSLTCGTSAALVRKVHLSNGLIGLQMVGVLGHETCTGQCQFGGGQVGEGHHRSKAGSGGAVLLRMAVAIAHRTLRSAELLQGIPRGFHRLEFLGSVGVRYAGSACRAIVMTAEFDVNDAGERPVSLVRELGDELIHRYY